MYYLQNWAYWTDFGTEELREERDPNFGPYMSVLHELTFHKTSKKKLFMVQQTLSMQ
jgi:hypothetical protein